MDGIVYDLCIVGAGLIGSAAARHATIISPNAKICLIGPNEPKNAVEQEERSIFASHYDEGRITRILDTDPTWSVLSRRSVSRYRDIEQKTGIQFFSEVGHLVVFPQEDEEYLQKLRTCAAKYQVKANLLGHQELAQRFDYLSIRPQDVAVHEERNSGHLSPRALLLAQQTVAHLQGCDIIDDVIVHVSESIQSTGSGQVIALTTEKRRILHARKVLLTTGAFTTFRRLLPPGKELDVQLKAHTLGFAQITPEDAKRMENMPAVVRRLTTIGKYDFCMLPPIKYPDGKFYLKIGHSSQKGNDLHTENDVKDWFKKTEGCKSMFQQLMKAMFDIVKGVQPVSTHSNTCVTTLTPTLNIYCDMVTPTLGLAVGGCGHGAKASDEIGKMAARMVIAGKWDHDLPADRFRVRFKNEFNSKL